MKKEDIIAVVPSYLNIVDKDAYISKWMNLLNNKKLIKYLKDTKTKIYFYSNGDVKVENKHVEIIYDVTNIEDMASLLITDYSSKYLDFSEISKPIIYYQFNKIPGFDYKKAFGKVITEEEAVVDKIVAYINMDYKIENYYQKRINKFFKELKEELVKGVKLWKKEN